MILKKKGKKAGLFLLTAILLLGQSSATLLQVQAYSGTPYPEISVDETVDGDQLTPSLYDVTLLQDAIDTLHQAIAVSDNEEAVLAAFENLIVQADEMYTVQSIDHIFYYADVNDQEVVDLYKEMDALGTEYSDLAAIALYELMNSEYAYIGEENMDAINAEYYREYNAMTDRQKEIKNQLTELESAYNQLMLEEITVTFGDQEWTDSTAFDAYQNEEITYEEYNDIQLEIAKEKNASAGEIFLEMVALHVEDAKEEGEENFAEWYYREMFIRDYTTEDIEVVYEQVKEYIVPLFEKLMNTMYSKEMLQQLYGLFYEFEPSYGDDLVAEVGECIAGVSEELGENFAFMMDHHLVDFDPDEKKTDVGFTTDLYSYGVPYIFYKPSESYYDYDVLTHEFGHYNHELSYPEHALTGNSNMDTAEIHSQGLELLSLDQMEPVFGDKLDAYKLVVLINMLGSVTSGCLFDEFQVEVYNNPDMTLDEMNELFYQLACEYGLEENYNADEETGMCYSWVEVSHTFEVPMYYISYATSALAALDIYTIYLENPEEGLDTYMKAVAQPSDVKFRAFLQECGLDDIFEEGVIEEISLSIKQGVIGTSDDDTEETEESVTDRSSEKKRKQRDTADEEETGDIFDSATDSLKMVPFVILIVLAVIVLVLIIVIIIALKHQKGQSDKNDQNIQNVQNVQNEQNNQNDQNDQEVLKEQEDTENN